jgi:cell wall-associated NlpC family hydrolase
MKRYIVLTTAVFALNFFTTATATADASIILRPISPEFSISQSSPQNLLEFIEQSIEAKTLLEKQAEENKKRKEQEALRHKEMLLNQEKIHQRLKDLEKQVGVTWYVFSGSTPQGWDCSGLTRWFYEGLEIEIPHSADKQSEIGTVVSIPQKGDIVLFDYENNKRSYDHAGIYIGDGKMIHSGGKKGDKTEIQDVNTYGLDSLVVYIRLLDTPK